VAFRQRIDGVEVGRVACVVDGHDRAWCAGVMAAATASGSMHIVSGSMSTSTGFAPRCTATFAVAANVSDGTITSSPGPMPNAASDRCNPAVHDESMRLVSPGAPT
jgi:hypothetical protein